MLTDGVRQRRWTSEPIACGRRDDSPWFRAVSATSHDTEPDGRYWRLRQKWRCQPRRRSSDLGYAPSPVVVPARAAQVTGYGDGHRAKVGCCRQCDVTVRCCASLPCGGLSRNRLGQVLNISQKRSGGVNTLYRLTRKRRDAEHDVRSVDADKTPRALFCVLSAAIGKRLKTL